MRIDKVYLLTFSEGEFIRKTERGFREKILKDNNKFVFTSLSKPLQNNELDMESYLLARQKSQRLAMDKIIYEQ